MRSRSDVPDTRSPRYGPLRGIYGFTLLELLVVLAIMAVLLLVVPRATAGLPSIRLRAAAAELAETLRQTRDEAIRTGGTEEVVFDAGQLRYTASDGKVTQLPEIVEVIEVTLEGPGAGGSADRLRFFSDGGATGGAVTLQHGRRRATIVVDWLTGRVRVDD